MASLPHIIRGSLPEIHRVGPESGPTLRLNTFKLVELIGIFSQTAGSTCNILGQPLRIPPPRQLVNLWTVSEAFRRLAYSPALTAMVDQLRQVCARFLNGAARPEPEIYRVGPEFASWRRSLTGNP